MPLPGRRYRRDSQTSALRSLSGHIELPLVVVLRLDLRDPRHYLAHPTLDLLVDERPQDRLQRLQVGVSGF